MQYLLSQKTLQVAACLLAVVAVGSAFAPVISPSTRHQAGALSMTSEESQPTSSSSSSAPFTDTTTNNNNNNNNDNNQNEKDWFSQWAHQNGLDLHPNLSIRDPNPADDRGKGGVEASGPILALDVLARIPRTLVVSAVDAPTRAMEAAATAQNFSWAADLTAAALVALHPTDDEELERATTGRSVVKAKQEWIQTAWKAGGWATDGADLGPPEANFGSKDVTGSLMATGSDLDHNIYAKFRMPCHPVLLRASLGLSTLTGCTETEARDALTCRGRSYRSMRDALEGLVLAPSERSKGSNREKRCWDVADTLSRVLSRATMLQLDDNDSDNNNNHPIHAVVPLHERLAHCGPKGENSKLVASGDDILLVATRDIEIGEAICRDYTAAPRLDQDESQGPLHLLLQFGLPPSAW